MGLRARFYFLSFALLSRLRFRAFPRIYDPPSRHDLSTAFLNWPSIQLNIHTTGNCTNTKLGRERDVSFLARLGRFKFGALPRTYDLLSRNDLPTAFLNWPNIQLNIHTTENYANTELD